MSVRRVSRFFAEVFLQFTLPPEKLGGGEPPASTDCSLSLRAFTVLLDIVRRTHDVRIQHG